MWRAEADARPALERLLAELEAESGRTAHDVTAPGTGVSLHCSKPRPPRRGAEGAP